MTQISLGCMSIPDLINGGFEVLGSVALWLNVVRLIRDKQIRGTVWQLAMFFLSWSLWNIYYYPHLNQWLSFYGGLSLAAANTMWVILAVYYSKKDIGPFDRKTP